MCGVALAMAACASDAPTMAQETKSSPVTVVPETVYVQLDGVGATPPDEFRPPEQERYLEIIAAGLRASGAFAHTEIWSRSAPPHAVIVDAHVEAAIDNQDSWSKAAWLMVVPVRTVGDVRVRFHLRLGDQVLDTRRYRHEVVTYVVPAAELGGRTWVEKSGILERFARQFGDDLEIRALLQGQPLAAAVR